MRRRVAPWLICSLAFSIAAFIAGAVSLGGIGHILMRPTTYKLLLLASFAFSIAWLLLLIITLAVHRWRGLWLLIGVPGAIFWPAIILFLIQAISGCVATHPFKVFAPCMP